MSETKLEALTPRAWHLPNGVELHTVRAGHGAPLVLIHGAMGDWRGWGAQWPALTPHFDCIAYSRRYSHPNRNDMPSPDHGAFHEAEDLALLLDAMDIREPVILVGSSYGGFVALALAARHPERVRAVVAVEPPMMKYAERHARGAPVVQAFRRDVIEPARIAFAAGDDLKASQIMTAGIGGAGAPPAGSEAMTRRMQNMRAMKMLNLSSDEFPWIAPETLQALPMPVMLLSGANTPPVHAAIFEAVCEAMPAARVHKVPGSGHSVSREQPEAFNALALDFLASYMSTLRTTRPIPLAKSTA